MSKQPLFNAFSPVSKATWREQVEKDLKGAAYDEKLRIQKTDGYTLEAFYHADEKEDWQVVEQTLHNQSLNQEQPALGVRHWYNQPALRLEEGQESAWNVQALEALQNGADALLLDLRGCQQPPRWERLLKGILLPYCRLSLWFPQTIVAADWFQTFARYTQTMDVVPAEITGSLLGVRPDENSADWQEQLTPFTGLRSFVIEAPTARTPSEQIAVVLQEVAQLAQEVQRPAEVWARTECFVPVGHDYFEGIAKLRALRFLLIQLAQLYEQEARSLPIHAYTHHAPVSLPEADTHFLISNTTQAMAGILGGATALTVLPHQENRTFAHRIARNVSNMLRQEAYLEKVADPVAGAYYIEKHTDALARAAWKEFQEAVQ